MHHDLAWHHGFFFGWFIGDMILAFFLRQTPRDWVKRALEAA